MLITGAERDTYVKRGVARWFRETDSATEGTDRDPFEPVPGWRGYYRVRSRPDGACGFLSSEDRCRIHEELGGAAKPLTCRMFPFKFHPVAGGAVVTASFGCPTIVANRGELVSRMLARADAGTIDLRANVQRIAAALDDLTRSRVLRLPDADFAEYIKLTLPYAAASTRAREPGVPNRIGRLMQFGFLYLVAATRYGIDHRTDSTWSIRLARLQMLAHFHRLAPAMDRVDVGMLRRTRVDINAPEIQPVAYHYLRAGIEALGARERPILDDFAIAVSCLNAACALAVMHAHAVRQPIDRRLFSDALMESVDVLQADERGLLGWALPRLAGGVEALKLLSAPTTHART